MTIDPDRECVMCHERPHLGDGSKMCRSCHPKYDEEPEPETDEDEGDVPVPTPEDLEDTSGAWLTDDADTGEYPTDEEIPDSHEVIFTNDGRVLYLPKEDDRGIRTDPEEFLRFDRLLRDSAPDGYTPFYLPCEYLGKGPDTRFGSWGKETDRLTTEEAHQRLLNGENVGIAGIGEKNDEDDADPDTLVHLDVDKSEALQGETPKPTLSTKSRSRPVDGGHFLYFEQEDIPNISETKAGEVRTNNQYVAAPGSVVPVELSNPDDPDFEDIPDGEKSMAGRYSVSDDRPAENITFAELPREYRGAYLGKARHRERREERAEGEGLGGSDALGEFETTSGVDTTAAFDLDIGDVTGLGEGRHEVNPLGHHDNSKGYYEVYSSGTGYDHKYGATYNGLTFILCDEGERSDKHPEGPLSRHEKLVVWREAKARGFTAQDDPIPRDGLVAVALEEGLCGESDIEEGWKLPFDVYNEALEAVRDVHGVEPGRSPLSAPDAGSLPNVEYPIETCAPPLYDTEKFDQAERWDEISDERIPALVDAEWPTTIFADPAGAGKSTNAPIGLAAMDEAHTLFATNHEKAHEWMNDPVMPNGYFHLKGGEQPIHDCCMDAKAKADPGETPECRKHGGPAEWPHMSPIYDFGHDSDVRALYETLLGVMTPRESLTVVDGVFDGHNLLEDNPWLDQFDGLGDKDRIIAVHPHQTLKSVTEGHRCVVDESPQLSGSEDSVNSEKLVRMAKYLGKLSGVQKSGSEREHNFYALAEWVEDLADRMTDDGGVDLEDLDTPDFEWEEVEELVDPIGGYYRSDTNAAESLAQLKIAYNGSLVTRVRKGTDNGEPFAFDIVLAALAAAAGDDDELNFEARRAVAAPSTLRECPWCGASTTLGDGKRHCSSDDCEWEEGRGGITETIDTPARIDVVAFDGIHDEYSDGEGARLESRKLPNPDELPNPLVLDATATPSKVAAYYGETESNIEVYGDEQTDFDGKAHVVQVLNGQYHAGTLKKSEYAREQFQDFIDRAGKLHEKPLFVVKSALNDVFDFPENGTVKKYHANRGLNLGDHDAYVGVGAPHPLVSDLERDANLLTMDRDDLEAGGEHTEHSTRRDAPHEPVYTKLLYEDGKGDGLAVPTKRYTGMTGELFYEGREKEMEQSAHRIRPLLVGDDEPTKNIYLLSNVPTDLPVDETATLDEINGNIETVFPAPEGAIRMLGYANDLLNGDHESPSVPDGFRASTLTEVDGGDVSLKVSGWHDLARRNGETVGEKTIRRWLEDLEDLGLIDPGEYEHRRGVTHTAEISTLTSALQCITNSASVEVAAMRRLKAKMAESGGTLDWLDWAMDVMDLGGDRSGVDSPPPGAPNPT